MATTARPIALANQILEKTMEDNHTQSQAASRAERNSVRGVSSAPRKQRHDGNNARLSDDNNSGNRPARQGDGQNRNAPQPQW